VESRLKRKEMAEERFRHIGSMNREIIITAWHTAVLRARWNCVGAFIDRNLHGDTDKRQTSYRSSPLEIRSQRRNRLRANGVHGRLPALGLWHISRGTKSRPCTSIHLDAGQQPHRETTRERSRRIINQTLCLSGRK
jgi:hypothetical protein